MAAPNKRPTAVRKTPVAVKKRSVTVKKEPYPWVLLLLFLGSIYVFWLLPLQLGTTPPQVTFESALR